jgi:hypothetical protein
LWLRLYNDKFPITSGYVPDAKTFFEIFGVEINSAKAKAAGFDSSFRKYGMRVVIGGDSIHHDFMTMLYKYTQLHPMIDPEVTQPAAEYIASRIRPNAPAKQPATTPATAAAVPGFIQPLSSIVQRAVLLNQAIRSDVHAATKHFKADLEK